MVVGNLVYSLVLGMSVPDVSGSAIANLEVESLTHRRPTFHGDTIYAETRVLDKRESSSKPDRGVVTVETKGFNQRGEEVCYFRRKVMVWKREAAPARRRPYPDGVWRLTGWSEHRRPCSERSWPGPERTRRDLPWRRTRDPWAVLVSELMLQQTQVARVVPRYAAFLDRFPTPPRAPPRRSARSSRRGPVSATTAGRSTSTVPRRPWLSATAAGCPTASASSSPCPGIGPYTARAVLAFAFERRHGVVETNVARVLARAVAAAPAARDEAQAWRRRGWFPTDGRGPGIRPCVDLGATVCVARAPRAANGARWPGAGCAPGWPAAARSRIRRSGSAGTSGRQSRFRRLGPPRPGPPGRCPAAEDRCRWSGSPSRPAGPTIRARRRPGGSRPGGRRRWPCATPACLCPAAGTAGRIAS